MKKQNIGEILRFGITGALATAIHYGIYLLASLWMDLTLAYCIGYAISFICNFYLSSLFTFQVKPSIKKGIGFMGCHIINCCVQLLLFRFFLHLDVPPALIPLCVYAIAIPLNFILVRRMMKPHL